MRASHPLGNFSYIREPPPAGTCKMNFVASLHYGGAIIARVLRDTDSHILGAWIG